MQHNSWGIVQYANTCIHSTKFILWRFTSIRSPEFHSPGMAALSASNRSIHVIIVFCPPASALLYTMCFVQTAQHLYSLIQTRTKNRSLLRHRGLKHVIRDFCDVMSENKRNQLAAITWFIFDDVKYCSLYDGTEIWANYQSQVGMRDSDFGLKRPSKTWHLFALSVIAGADNQ